MGYPMTYRRFLNRNGLTTGGYSDKPEWPLMGYNNAAIEDEHLRIEHERLCGRVGLMLGDLRRLEHDAVDENASGICGDLARRTGVDPDVVAVVLKEFIAW